MSEISANENVFKEAAPVYQEALNSSGHNFKLKFEPNTNNNNKPKNRFRNITWFNPPFSLNVRTNVGARFLKIIETSFPLHPYKEFSTGML